MYESVSFWKYLMGAAIILLPAAYLANQNQSWAWKYTFLILLMVIVTNYGGVEAFAGFISSELRSST